MTRALRIPAIPPVSPNGMTDSLCSFSFSTEIMRRSFVISIANISSAFSYTEDCFEIFSTAAAASAMPAVPQYRPAIIGQR